MTNPNPDVIAMARRIAEEIKPEPSFEKYCAFQAALLAIQETTDRAAKWLNGNETPFRHGPAITHEAHRRDMATALRQFTHLKGPDHD